MIGALKAMFSGADIAGTIIDKAASGLDKLHFGDQEQAEHNLKMREQAFGVIMSWLESTKGSRIARRFLAVGSFLVWVSFYILAASVNIIGIWAHEPGAAEALNPNLFKETSEALFSYASDMKPIIVTVFAFYFGGPVVMDATKNVMTKWAEK